MGPLTCRYLSILNSVLNIFFLVLHHSWLHLYLWRNWKCRGRLYMIPGSTPLFKVSCIQLLLLPLPSWYWVIYLLTLGFSLKNEIIKWSPKLTSILKPIPYFMLLLNLFYLGVNKRHRIHPCTQVDSIILLLECGLCFDILYYWCYFCGLFMGC